MADIMNAMLISIYVLLFLIGLSIVIYAVFKYKRNINITFFEHFVIVGFTLICLAFGIYVSYSDFWGGKEITCFLTMVLYVGCLLIYRPFISVLILGASFYVFHAILLTFQNGLTYAAQDVVISGVVYKMMSGDTINYITFFISLTTICFAIYHGRLNEARKSKDLEKSATEDALTGMYNYSRFSDLAKERMRRAADNLSDSVFLFLDIHNFKAFNDQRGFEAGNRFLITIGNHISSIFQDSLCARQADDHFVVLTRTNGIEEKLNALNKLVHEYDAEILLGINCGAYHPGSRRIRGRPSTGRVTPPT